jgi:putative membrane protein
MRRSKTKSSEKQERALKTDSRLHMANERTFLAWIRTSIGIMIFGFVVERFAVPSEPLLPASPDAPANGSGYLAKLGICLVLLGVAASLLATYRFLRIQKHIMEDTYRPSMVRYVLLAVLLGSIGVLVAIHLAHRMHFL